MQEGVLSEEQIKSMEDGIRKQIEKAYDVSKSHQFNIEEWKNEEWEGIKQTSKYGEMKNTGVSLSVLKDIGEKITTLPEDWEFHPQVKKIFEARKKSISEGKGIDWGTGEALAFASLIHEGFHVRVSGQDVERGTFSHRHAVVFH